MGLKVKPKYQAGDPSGVSNQVSGPRGKNGTMKT